MTCTGCGVKLSWIEERAAVKSGLKLCIDCCLNPTPSLAAYVGNPADPWCNRCQAHHKTLCPVTPERSEAPEDARSAVRAGR